MSYVERQGLTIRMCVRSLRALANGFSNKREKLDAALAPNFAYHNFSRAHQTLEVGVAMEADISDHICTVEEPVAA